MPGPKSPAMQHGVTRAVIALVIVAAFVFVGASMYLGGSAVIGVLVSVVGVVLGGLVWRDR